ncbi:surface-adhesin E family protein [Methylocystis echinoides]|uniref:surface-adhesin E family protein n=1 Tax=Methylocystis echinoides TaxID=29468 RepID=UPI0034296F4C
MAMRKMLIVAGVFFLSSSLAYAKDPDWKLSGSAADDEIYFDQNNYENKQGAITFWLLFNSRKPDGKVLSYTVKHALDCAKDATTVKMIVNYPEPMGKGQPIEVVENDVLLPDEMPGSYYGKLKALLCGKSTK